MPQIHKVLGQLSCALTTLETLYTVPASTSAVVSTLTICNRGVSTTFRVAVRLAGASIANQHYICYDCYIEQFSTIFLTLGITLAATDVVSIYVGAATISANLYGVEIT
jgi:hypothetical protein